MTKPPSGIDKLNAIINKGTAAIVGYTALATGLITGGQALVNRVNEARADFAYGKPKTINLVDVQRHGNHIDVVGVDPETRRDTTRFTTDVLNTTPEHNRVTNNYAFDSDGYIQADKDFDDGKINSVDVLEKSWASDGEPRLVMAFNVSKSDMGLQEKVKNTFHVPSATHKNLQGAFFYKK